MHNLEESIAEWRRSMQSAPNLGTDALDELENHLRESVDRLVRSGMAEPEAFQRAVAQLGSPPTVGSEFGKLKKRTWLPVTVAKVILGLGVIEALLLTLSFRERNSFVLLLHAHFVAINLGHITALLLGMFGACFVCQRSWSDFSDRQQESLCRSVGAFARLAMWLVGVGMILGMIWSKMKWGHFWSWQPKEIGSLGILLWLAGFLTAHRSRSATPRGLLVLSVLSANWVLLGWFVPELVILGWHHYPMAAYGLFAACETLGLLLFLIGLAPAGWLRLRRKVV